jgi:predicted membrane protein
MENKKRHMLTGGMILITLGVLIFLHMSGYYFFSKSWPILLIVIGVCTIIQSIRDIGGWFITIAGIIFVFTEAYGIEIYKLSKYLLPALLILVGIHVLLKRRKRNP